MPVEYHFGKDIFSTDDKWLVNAINGAGVMGGGLARAMSIKWPEILEPYIEACKNDQLNPGDILITDTNDGRYIINAVSVDSDLFLGKLEFIKDLMNNILELVNRTGIKSLSMTDIGCGIGGLERDDVFPIINKAFALHPCRVRVYTR